MTELIITPNYDKKTARFKGTIAGGESVKVTIVGAANWLSSGLRLRVVCGCSKTVAMFPLKSEDGTVSSFEVEGDDLIAAPLELNTIQARLYTQGLATTAATFIVEDLEKNILYFQDSYELHGWVKRDGDEEPYDLTKFPELIEDWRKQIENLIVDAKEVDGGIEVTICNGVSPAKTFIIRNGRDGAPGEPGRKGEDGKSLKFDDLTEAQKAELKGPKGDTGEGITDELKALPNKVTENAQAIEANRVAINTEENRAKGAEKELLTRVEESKANAAAAMTAASKAQDTADKTVTEIATLVGDDAGDKRKSARQIAAEEVAKVVANAPADLDTLKEIAAYIESDKTGAAQMVTQVDANAKAISAEESRAKDAEAALAGRVKELEENGGGDVDVVAEIEGKEIKPSSVVMPEVDGRHTTINSMHGFIWKESTDTTSKNVGLNATQNAVSLALFARTEDARDSSVNYGSTGIVAYEEDYENEENRSFNLNFLRGTVSYSGPEGEIENTIANMVNAMPRYPFVNADWVVGDIDIDVDDGKATLLFVKKYHNSYYNTSSSNLQFLSINLPEGETSDGLMRDAVLVIDMPEGSERSVDWMMDVHPRSGDAANLEVVAGKRNVFFITEVQPNVFMVARDELALSDAGGGE